MMTTIQRPRTHANIRALSSITPQQATIITQAVQASSHAWDVMTLDDYDGYLSVLAQPSIGTDQQISFFISGTAQSLELTEVNGDDLVTVAHFSSAEALSIRLRELIAQQ